MRELTNSFFADGVKLVVRILRMHMLNKLIVHDLQLVRVFLVFPLQIDKFVCVGFIFQYKVDVLV